MKYSGIKEKGTDKIYIIRKTSELNTVKGKWFLANPFDSWGGLYWFGRPLYELNRILKTKEFLERFECFNFKSKGELLEFINKHEPIERRQLIDKYKNTKIIDVPIGDLKILGFAIAV